MKGRGIYSQDLGINLASGKEGELFKWFLACLLFGKPIQQEVARKTYFEFMREGLVSPEKIAGAGWDRLVAVLDAGHYVRYDFSTADKLLEICGELMDKYGGLSGLLEKAGSRKELSRLLQEFRGIGPVTARIFLRDLPIITRQTSDKS